MRDIARSPVLSRYRLCQQAQRRNVIPRRQSENETPVAEGSFPPAFRPCATKDMLN
ncbi:MAG: hypothetical protein ABF888_05160 [Acetobacter papayae]